MKGRPQRCGRPFPFTRRVAPALLLLGSLVPALAGCGGGDGAPASEDTMPPRPIAEVLQEVAPEWMALEGVVMVYESAREDGSPCLKVGVKELTPELRRRIPEIAGGYPVILVETGPVAPR